MKRSFRFVPILPVLAGLLLLAPAPLASQGNAGGEALGILEAAAERFGNLSAFCARFDQEIQNRILRQNTRSHGELCQARPDRFAMDFAAPEGDRVVADGETIWIYFPSTDPGQVFRSRTAVADGRFDLHREFLSEPGERYAPTLEGTEVVDGTETHRLHLEPLQPSPYRSARIWVGAEDPLIHRLEITEDDGLVRVLELSEMRLNPSLPSDRFDFEPPAGAHIIDRDGRR
jgi:outer membrane lipoprotein carrier protein